MTAASIITVCRNSVNFIEATLKSVHAQRGVDVEHIVIDGQSTDGTVDILRKYDSDIAYWTSEQDGSMYEALNKGLKVVSGDFVGIVNSDDMLFDHSTLLEVANAFERSPSADGIYGDQIVLYEHMKRYKKVFQVNYRDYLISGKGTFVPHGSFFLRRNFAVTLGDYDTRYKYASDYDYILRALDTGHIRYMPIPLSKFRVHLDSISSTGQLASERDQIIFDHIGLNRAEIIRSSRSTILWTKYRLLQVIFLLYWPHVQALCNRIRR